MIRFALWALLVLMLAWAVYPYADAALDFSDAAPRPPDGQVVTKAPSAKTLSFNGRAADWTSWEIMGRVLSRKKYPTGGRRFDIVVGWGSMSDNRVIDSLRVRQLDHTHQIVLAPGATIALKDAYEHTMNVAFVTKARPSSLDELREIRVGDIVWLFGTSHKSQQCGDTSTGRRCLVLEASKLQINDRRVFGSWDAP